MKIIGIDPGSKVSGIAMLDENGVVAYAGNIENEAVLGELLPLCENPDISIAIETIAPYVGRLSPHTISTAMWIGELAYRIRTELYIEPCFVARNSVKHWIYEKCPEICIPLIEKKMLSIDKRKVGKGEKGLRKNSGEMRLPSFNWVDDRVIIAVLKHILNIPTPKPGKRNQFGLASHGWQACAVAAYRLSQIPSLIQEDQEGD